MKVKKCTRKKRNYKKLRGNKKAEIKPENNKKIHKKIEKKKQEKEQENYKK